MTMPKPAEKKAFWKYEPDALAEPPERAAMFHVFAGKECQRHLELFEQYGEPVHLWKAWRSARACGAIPPDVFERLVPYLDKLTSLEVQGETPARAKQREDRAWILRDYYYEKAERDAMLDDPEKKSSASSMAEIYRRVASRHDTTPGSIEQMVLKHEHRDGRR